MRYIPSLTQKQLVTIMTKVLMTAKICRLTSFHPTVKSPRASRICCMTYVFVMTWNIHPLLLLAFRLPDSRDFKFR